MTPHGRRRVGRALFASGMLLLAAGTAAGHGSGAVIEVEPSTVTAGGTVTLVGENLEPNDDRILILTGADVRLELGTVTTDAEGMFSIEIVIPAHLPSAVYEFQAIGDETLTVPLNVEGMAGSSPGSQPTTAEPAPRQRSGFDLAAMLAVAIASLAAGVFLAVRAERIGGHRSPTS
jgi:hypothetical protein